MAEKRTILRRMQRPWVSAVLLVVLGADFVRLCMTNVGVGATVRDWVFREGEVPRQTNVMYFHRVDGKYVPLFRDGESANEFSSLLSTEPQNVLYLESLGPEVHGLWVPFLRSNPVRVGWMDRSSVDGATRERVISEWTAQVASSWESAGYQELANEVRKFHLGTTQILWIGVSHNLAAVAIGASLIVSLGWLPAWLRALRKQPWQCRRCGYDLRGVGANACPECGASGRPETKRHES